MSLWKRGSRRQRRDRWVYVSLLLPFGFGAWAPIIAGRRCRVWWWSALGVCWSGCTIAALIVGGSDHSRSGGAVVGALLWCGWIGGVVTSFAIRPAYDRRRGFPLPDRDWPQPTKRSENWTARYAMLAFVAVFLLLAALGVIFRAILHVHVSVGPAVLVTDATLLAALVPVARRRGLAAPDLGIRPTIAMPSLGLVLLALFTYLAIAVVWTIAFIGNSSRHSANLISQVNHLGTLGTIIAVVAVAISAPAVEEIFFRGFLYRSLRNRLPVAQAALIAGCVFGFAHITGYPLITLPIKACFGVIACLMYERTGSLLPGMALHCFVDASAIELALTGNVVIALIVAGVAIVLLLGRAALLGRTPAGENLVSVLQPVEET